MARRRWADMADSSAEDLSQPTAARPRWADMADSSVEDMSQHMSPPIFQDTYEDREGASQELLGERLEDAAELQEPDATLEDVPEADSLPAVLAGVVAVAQARPRPTSSLSRARPLRESDVGEALQADGADRKRPQAAANGATPAFKRRRTPNSLEETPDERGSTAASSSAASSSAAPPSSQPQAPTDANDASAAMSSDQPQGALDDSNVERALQKRRAVVNAHKHRPDYLAFSAARPRHLRTPDEPMTPDTEETMPKRQWETRIQRWREGLREWYAANGGGNGHDQEPEAA
eukprot:TRINITY_DN48855_c0_g1_i1.p1 TRINITY_DN48855_c0_g1~~TRINITY_DN48855_c0_g1_i1.p1  ORF type:complete len:292 (+),score=62.41 TRINITY_DN48855_c0_g1_i1:42-917(+)